ncbi:hypothetical protein FNT36_01975 [Hymenobacter setariae]|uniref:Uncharacterized protein n=1 Tax=Hymenobacter setariae TaxID=2594794 RepID=A0A558C269_9BACT|nr:hypothetical protein [Hymenobacter setariae]TVT42883.1 hypothetical protein FNT36_01975 [Hymenobacter setariae]
MFNFWNKNKISIAYPIVSIGLRGEDIEYITETESVYIGFTYIDGKRIYLDFTHWKSKIPISAEDKETIFVNCLNYCNKYSFRKTIAVINSDIDKEFWFYICEKYKSKISAIEYTSKHDNQQLLLKMFMQQVLLHGKVKIGNTYYFTESEILDYLRTQQ